MDDKNNIKENFLSCIVFFLSYRPSFLYCFKIDKVNFLVSTKRYDKFIIFFDKFTVFNLNQYYCRNLQNSLKI